MRGHLRALVLSAPLLIGPVGAAQQTPDAAKVEQAQERMDELKSRLQLTPGQEGKVREIFQAEGQKLQALRGDKEFQSMNRREKRSLQKQVKEIRKETDTQLAGVLSKEQMGELQKFRKEQRDRMIQQFKARKG